MSFSEQEICIVMWFDAMNKLSPMPNPCSPPCWFLDTVMTGCAEHAHQLNLTGANLKSQKWSSKSWACSAITSYTILTPLWWWNHFNCGQSIIPECLCFRFLGEQTPTAFMACCSSAQSWWDTNSWVDDRLRPCKHISLMSPSHIFIVGLSARVGE